MIAECGMRIFECGATDYVLKDRLYRLGFVVKRVVVAEAYRERKWAEEVILQFKPQELFQAIERQLSASKLAESKAGTDSRGNHLDYKPEFRKVIYLKIVV